MLSGRGQSLSLGMRRGAQREEVAQLRSPSRQGQCTPPKHSANPAQRTLRDLPLHCLRPNGSSLAPPFSAAEVQLPCF